MEVSRHILAQRSGQKLVSCEICYTIGTFASKQTYFPPSPTKPIPIVYYRSDGSGRDNYICSTSGGFHPEGMGKKVDVHFLSTLRSPSEDRVS